MQNPVYGRALFKVWGSCTQDAAERWDDIMRNLYKGRGIENQNQLSIATGIPVTTLQSNGAYLTPHTMTYRTFIKVCAALGVDADVLIKAFLRYDPEAIARFSEEYENVKERLGQLVEKFLMLDPSKQDIVLQMMAGIDVDSDGGDWHAVACGLLTKQMRDVMDRCKSWDYIDLTDTE